MEGEWFPLVVLAALLVFGAALLFILKRSQREDDKERVLPSPGEKPPSMQAVDEHIERGDKAAAIREYRRLTGAFEPEARALVERRVPQAGTRLPADSSATVLAAPGVPEGPPSERPEASLDDVKRLLAEGKPIDAMSLYRQLSGASEDDVKATIDRLISELPPRP